MWLQCEILSNLHLTRVEDDVDYHQFRSLTKQILNSNGPKTDRRIFLALISTNKLVFDLIEDIILVFSTKVGPWRSNVTRSS